MPNPKRQNLGAKTPDVVPKWFRKCLRKRREAQNLSKVELAALAGIDEKTVRDIESGRQQKPLRSTLLLIAKALDCSIEELTSNCLEDLSWFDRNRMWVLTGAGVVVTIFIAIITVGLAANNWTQTREKIVVSDGVFGTEIWKFEPGYEIREFRDAPWGKNEVIVAFGKDAPDGGYVAVFNRITGNERWRATLDVEQSRTAFGSSIVDLAKFGANDIVAWNRDGLGEPEIAVRFYHGKLYPNAIISINSDGEVQSQYNFLGHVSDIVVWDLDRDGRDELIVGSTNNSAVYQGGMITILNEDNFAGASVDSFAMTHPQMTDGSLARVIYPAFPDPFMKQMSEVRLRVLELQVIERENGETLISASVGCVPDERLTIFMDTSLQPVRVDIIDTFYNTLESWPDSLTDGSGPGDPEWRDNWLATSHHFGGWKR